MQGGGTIQPMVPKYTSQLNLPMSSVNISKVPSAASQPGSMTGWGMGSYNDSNIAGSGLGLVGTAAGILGNAIIENNATGGGPDGAPKAPPDKWGQALTYGSTGLGLGATLGSVVPGVGNVVGGAVGGVIGGAYGLIEGWTDQEEYEDEFKQYEMTKNVRQNIYNRQRDTAAGYGGRYRDTNQMLMAAYGGPLSQPMQNSGKNENGSKSKQLKEVNISGISPREQAYRDSLALYNIFHRLDSIQSELLYGSRRNINNTVLTNSLGTFSLNDAKEDLEKLQKLARDYYHIKYPSVTVNKGEYYNIPPTEKPVYDPVPIRMPSRSAKINIPQQQRSIQKVKNGFTSDLPGYPTLKVQYNQNSKPMYIINRAGARIPFEPVPSRILTKEFAYPEKYQEGGQLPIVTWDKQYYEEPLKEKPLVSQAYGGQIDQSTQNIRQMPQVTEYNTGGTHEQNPNQGIPVDSEGNPATISGGKAVALTEAGEVAFRSKSGEIYVFSSRLFAD